MKVELPEIPVNYKDDLHNLEYLNEADLILFMAGNQFMVMEELLEAFQKVYPEVKKIFYETLPPGLELKQILAGGARFGDMEIKVTPDIYTAVSESAMQELGKKGLVKDYFIYLHNRIVLMVPKGNPAGIKNVTDLAQENIRISQPGPLEDITRYIVEMYKKAGGEELVHRIMEEKRAEGTTIFTLVHHRETPLRIVKRTVDVGPVWATEVIHAQNQGLPVEMVDPGEELDQRDKVNYYITALTNAPHPENAKKFLEFIKSSEAQKIYAKYGFVPHFPFS
ncbi:MAG: molybdenum ABC transporter substrate-binding protein [Thermodesulfobacteriota bacterium]|nr:substrate-binding domain-containing protein [Thermodesulfobacteriota bacterium]MCU4138945.1 ABC-type molybdate transport system [Thermodesulfobacteriota bacterium]RKX63776.1 MAG: molybdenum ABC transporter substrate-binding protein [Thermodesulfobacteriota bacterium]